MGVSFFSTIAQVSFTLAGLFVVAFASDGESRRFWFKPRASRLFTYTSLLIVVLPGLYAICIMLVGLPMQASVGLIFLFYFSWLIVYQVHKRDSELRPGLTGLESGTLPLGWVLLVALFFLLIATIYFLYGQETIVGDFERYMWVGFSLFLAIFVSSVQAVVVLGFRERADPNLVKTLGSGVYSNSTELEKQEQGETESAAVLEVSTFSGADQAASAKTGWLVAGGAILLVVVMAIRELLQGGGDERQWWVRRSKMNLAAGATNLDIA